MHNTAFSSTILILLVFFIIPKFFLEVLGGRLFQIQRLLGKEKLVTKIKGQNRNRKFKLETEDCVDISLPTRFLHHPEFQGSCELQYPYTSATGQHWEILQIWEGNWQPKIDYLINIFTHCKIMSLYPLRTIIYHEKDFYHINVTLKNTT